MTQKHNRKGERDEILFAFHQTCERPTAEDIIAWVEKYPEFAEDIRSHAAISRDWTAGQELSAVEADDTMLQRAYSNALNAMFDAEVRAKSAQTEKSARDFHDLLKERGKEIHQLAKDLDMGRSVLADLFHGWMLAPVRKRLVDAVTSALGITGATFDNALTLTLQKPYFGHAKAHGAPSMKPRPCDEIIRHSSMSEERKRYWLEKD
jgi:hypothetical protein